jgi:hypothetical protein
MKKNHYFLFFQQFYLLKKSNNSNSKQSGKYDTNKFSQMYDLLATPNVSKRCGAPGPAYYQQQADYKIDIELDDKNAKLNGSGYVL